MEQWQDCDAVEHHPEKLSGAWVFRGTRVPLPRCVKISAMVRQSISFSRGFLAYNAGKSKPSWSTKRWLSWWREPSSETGFIDLAEPGYLQGGSLEPSWRGTRRRRN